MVINGKRAVAYFDVLGFKNKINNISLDIISADYERLIKNTDGEFSIDNGKIRQEQVCYRYIFSDSLFLIAKEDSPESFIDLVSYSWRMMQQFLASGFPLRGAITYGEIYANLEKHIFLGKAITEAVTLEMNQNWIGAIVDQTAITQYEMIFQGDDVQSVIMGVLLPIYDVPLKGGLRQDYHVINWRQNIVSEDGIKALFRNEPYDIGAQTKIDNTLRFSKAIVDLGTTYFKDEAIPQRYRKLYIGHKVPINAGPMFQNGDEY